MLRKNPAHPATRSIDPADFTFAPVPKVPVPPNADDTPAGRAAAAAAAPAAQPPVQQAQAPTPPAAPTAPTAPVQPAAPEPQRRQTVLTPEEIAELSRRTEAAEARLASMPDEAEIERRVRAEISAQVDPELERLKRELDARDTELSEHRKRQRQQDLDNLVQFDPTQLGDLDPEVARAVADRVLKPTIDRVRQAMDQEVSRVSEDLQALRRAQESRFEEMDQREKRQLRIETNRRLLEAVPDFEALRNTTAFKEFDARTPPGGRRTFGEEMAEAYRVGDVDYIVKQVEIFKQGRPRLSDVADVDLTNTNTPAQPAADSEKRYTYADLQDASDKYRRGLMKREDFRRFRESFEAAEKAGRVS